MADKYMLAGKPFLVRFIMGGLLRPKHKLIGSDMAGQVEAVGADVTEFKVGDAVFGDLSASGRGAFAEYVCAPEDVLVMKPENISFEQAAAVPMAAVTALQGLREEGAIEAGQKVLINGASGGVGTFAVQIAKALGAEVTAVCSTRNMDRARSLGADHVIDYTKEDFTQQGQQYDLILAANGYHPLADYQRALSPTGRYVVTGGEMKQIFGAMLKGPWMSKKSEQRFSSLSSMPNKKVLTDLKGLIEAGKFLPIVDQSFSVDDAAKAFQYLEEGHAKGKIVIRHA